jgi:RNA recognition motif-containing protein
VAHTPYDICQDETVPTYNIFVGNLSLDATDEDLKAAYGALGPIHSASIGRERGSGRSKGFGFVNFLTEEGRSKALSLEHRDSVPVRGQKAKAYPSDTKNTLYVGNLPRSIKSEDAKKEIERITSLSVHNIALKTGSTAFPRLRVNSCANAP